MSIHFLLPMTGLLTAGLGAVTYIIAADRTRFLTRFDLGQWRESYYLRALPNFLQALHDNHFRTAWPAAHNAVAAWSFRIGVRRLIKRKPAFLRRAFLQQHIVLFGLLEVLKPYLKDYFLNEQSRIVAERVLEMEDTIERDRLIEFLDAAREERARFYSTLTRPDRQVLTQMAERGMVQVLRRTHAIFQEHGYSLLPELTQLRRWEEMTGAELVQELPVIAVTKARKVDGGSRYAGAGRRRR